MAKKPNQLTKVNKKKKTTRVQYFYFPEHYEMFCKSHGAQKQYNKHFILKEVFFFFEVKK